MFPKEPLVPYSNQPVAKELLGFAEPYKVALEVEITEAELVLTKGAPPETCWLWVVKLKIVPWLVPKLFCAIAR